ncbi:MAG: VWA domain-containing protein [Deltaproteobacteria bacterium]|jgi:uncharacterized protein YegL|nr:VWA domain-containing protein [Deltaproteobacteria bacterium]
MRKLPVYILVDTSGSMRGEPVESVKVGLEALFASLTRDAAPGNAVYVSVISFDREARLLMPLTSAKRAKLPRVPDPESSPTNLGEALSLLCQRYDLEVRLGGRGSGNDPAGDFPPFLVVMTDGSPSDTMLFEDMIPELGKRRFSRVIGCAAGPKAKTEPLKKFCGEVVILETMDRQAFSKFWNLVSDAVSGAGNEIVPASELPPPPPAPKLSI